MVVRYAITREPMYVYDQVHLFTIDDTDTDTYDKQCWLEQPLSCWGTVQ